MAIRRRILGSVIVVALSFSPRFSADVSAICYIPGTQCTSPPSGYCPNGVCWHAPSTNYYWDWDCYPVPCCEQGHCDTYEQLGDCNYFCYADNYAACAFTGCS